MVANSRTRNDVQRGLAAVVTSRFTHRLIFAREILGPKSRVLEALLPRQRAFSPRVLCFVDSAVAVAGLLPSIRRRMDRLSPRVVGPAQLVHEVPGGERAKNDRRILDGILKRIALAGLCRHSFVIVVGGGAVLDVVSYAAAIAHRGIRCIRVPTTTLSQADSGVGVKCGINAMGRKNFLGVFAPPWAVINDSSFLKTLPPRDWIAGLAEIVKVALIKDTRLFRRIERGAVALGQRDLPTAEPLIRRSAELHFRHISAGGDPFERGSARPLDFGHWAAHKLESMSAYRLRHGEAVAAGMIIDCVYARLLGQLAAVDLRRVLDLLRALGFKLPTELLSKPAQVLDGLEEFREHLGGKPQITLLRGIARPQECRSVARPKMTQAITLVSKGWPKLLAFAATDRISRRQGRA